MTAPTREDAHGGTEAAIWHAIEGAADAVMPGVGRWVRLARATASLVEAAESFVEGAVEVAVATCPRQGFGIDPRGTAVDSHGPAWSDANFAVAPRACVDEVRRDGERVLVLGPGTGVRAETGVERIDGRALVRYVRARGEPQPDLPPSVIVYLDPRVRVGLVAVVASDGDAYCPILFQVDQSVRLWSMPAVPAEPATPAEPTPRPDERTVVVTRVFLGRRDLSRLRPRGRRRGHRRLRIHRVHAVGRSSQQQQQQQQLWAMAYRGAAMRCAADLGTEVETDSPDWRRAFDEEHKAELAYIRADLEGPMARDGLTLAAAAATARRAGNLVDYAEALIAYVLVGLAQEHGHRHGYLVALFAAAGVDASLAFNETVGGYDTTGLQPPSGRSPVVSSGRDALIVT